MLADPQTCTFVEADGLASFQGSLIDVRPPEAFAEAHLAGTHNLCVYEVDFLEKFPEAYPDKAAKLLVYGDGPPYQADLAAAGRLQSLGYPNIYLLSGGLSQWIAESRPVEGQASSEAEALKTPRRLELDTTRSKLRWVGRNLANQHQGEVAASSGFLQLSADGAPAGGIVTADLRRLQCHDINDKGMAAALIGHLASIDFFEVANHPEASFKLVTASPIPEANYGMPNFQVSGILSARGLYLDLTIEALIEPIDNGYVFQSTFNFDRTQLGALYGSGRIFERLGRHLVNDLVSMDITAFFNVPK